MKIAKIIWTAMAIIGCCVTAVAAGDMFQDVATFILETLQNIGR